MDPYQAAFSAYGMISNPYLMAGGQTQLYGQDNHHAAMALYEQHQGNGAFGPVIKVRILVRCFYLYKIF